MAAIVKASPRFLAGELSLVNYSVEQTSALTLDVQAEFVAIASTNVEQYFKIGSQPPEVLQSNAAYIAALTTYKASRLPQLSSATVVTHAGLKTITATYSTEIEQTTSGDGVEDGNNYSEISTSTDWRSLSGSVENGETSYAWSFDYQATTVTVSVYGSGGAVAGSGQGSVGDIVNFRGGEARQFLSITTAVRDSTRTYRNSKGQRRTETTSEAYYVVA